jgi:hypothetical protein
MSYDADEQFSLYPLKGEDGLGASWAAEDDALEDGS